MLIARVLLWALTPAAAQDTFTLNVPSSLAQCGTQRISWEGGVGPYEVVAVAGGTTYDIGTAPAIATSINWQVVFAAGTSISLRVLNARGQVLGQTPLLTVSAGTATCKLVNGPTSSTSASSSSSVSPTSSSTSVTEPPITSSSSTSPDPTSSTSSSASPSPTSSSTSSEPSVSETSATESSSDYPSSTDSGSATESPSATVSTSTDPEGRTITITRTGSVAPTGSGEPKGPGGGSSQNLGAIIGGSVGGGLGLALIVALVVWQCMRRRKDEKSAFVIDTIDTEAAEPGPVQMITPYPIAGMYKSSSGSGAYDISTYGHSRASQEHGAEDHFATDAGPVSQQWPPQYDPGWSQASSR